MHPECMMYISACIGHNGRNSILALRIFFVSPNYLLKFPVIYGDHE